METVKAIYRSIFREDPPAETSLESLVKDIEAVKQVFEADDVVRQIKLARSAAAPGDTSTKTAEELLLQRVRAAAEAPEHKAIIDDKHTPPSVDDGYAFLKLRCEGKIVDNTYYAYCASIIRQYLSLRKKVGSRTEYAIMNGIMNLHLANIRPQYDYDLHHIMKHNDCIGYVQRTTIRLFNQIIEIPFSRITLEDLNVWRPASTLHPLKLR